MGYPAVKYFKIFAIIVIFPISLPILYFLKKYSSSSPAYDDPPVHRHNILFSYDDAPVFRNSERICAPSLIYQTPMDPIEPVGAVEPVEPVGAVQPVEPVELMEPMELNEPVEINELTIYEDELEYIDCSDDYEILQSSQMSYPLAMHYEEQMTYLDADCGCDVVELEIDNEVKDTSVCCDGGSDDDVHIVIQHKENDLLFENCRMECKMDPGSDSETEITYETDNSIQLHKDIDNSHKDIDNSHTRLPKPSSKINVGCTLPNIIPDKWNKFNAMVYTLKTKSKIVGNYVGTKANRDIAPESCITIIPESDDAEFKPKCKKDILWIDDYISEVFYIKLHNNQTTADIKVSFYLEDVAIPFGEISLVVSQNSTKQISSLLGIYLLYSERDEFIAQNIKNTLKLVNNIVNNPDSAERVQLLYSKNTDSKTIDKAIQYQDKLAVSFWDNADLSIWKQRSIQTTYYSNDVTKMFREIKQGQIESNQMLKQCINMLAANFEAICNSACDSSPHLFHIWPAKKPSGWKRLNPKNWFLYKYKLHLICEGAFDYTNNTHDCQHYVFEEHPGYDVNVPKDWFIKWRRIITITAKIIFISTKIALTASGVGSLSNMIPDNLSLETINQALPLLNIVSQDIIGKTIGEVVSEKSQNMLNDFSTALEEDSEMTNLVENANNAFNELESFLNGREPLPKFSGLIRDFHPNNIPNAGKATWVCKYHAQIIQKYKKNLEPINARRETAV